MDTNERLNYERRRTNNILDEGRAKVTKELFEESFSKVLGENPCKGLGGNAGKCWSTPVQGGSRGVSFCGGPVSSVKRGNNNCST